MNKELAELMKQSENHKNNYILPFLWMRGEEEDVIIEEIQKIGECGIRAFCLESRPHPDFMGDKWWSDLRMIIREAKKRDMKVWILDDAHFPTGYANGLIKEKYPERRKQYLNYNTVNVWGPKGEITIPVSKMQKPLVSFLELDKPRDLEEQGRNQLVAVVAYPVREELKLEESGAIDLTGEVKDGCVTWTFPQDNYRVYVIYETRTDGGNADYINMMDRDSVSTLIEAVYEPHFANFKEEFGNTIAGFFSDEPEIGNISGFRSDVQIGNSKMPLPWSRQLKEKMEEQYGGTWYRMLPLLWTESVQMQECAQARHHFMDAVSTLYSENFSMQLGEWCTNHGVEYIGHVVEDDNLHGRLGNGTAHYFRAMKGQHMAGIDVIGDQVYFGGAGYRRTGIFDRDGEFFHYALGKLGASCGHLDPGKGGRTMCELFGASGWKTGVRDMKWILNHLLARGINVLVPHAFSMSDYPDMDCPPHFYARGNNPQFRHFAELMKYANRMCGMLSGGKHIAPVAVLYHADAEWSGTCMLIQKPARKLLENQIEFDFVSADMLDTPEEYCGKTGTEGFSLNGQEFRCLVIPALENLPYGAYRFIRENPQTSVLFIDSLPAMVTGGDVTEDELQEALKGCGVIRLEELAAALRESGMAEIELTEAFSELVFYHYRKEQDYYMLNNESACGTYSGKIALPLKKGAVYYDCMKNKFFKMDIREEDGKKLVRLELRPYESCIIIDCQDEELEQYKCLTEKLDLAPNKLDLSDGWDYALASAKEYPDFGSSRHMEKLRPVSQEEPDFSGHICYEKEIEIKEVSSRMYLAFTHVFEVMELWVNDRKVGTLLNPPYIFEVGSYMKKGANRLRAVVTTTADREQMKYPEPFIRLSHEIMESTGMYGEIALFY